MGCGGRTGLRGESSRVTSFKCHSKWPRLWTQHLMLAFPDQQTHGKKRRRLDHPHLLGQLQHPWRRRLGYEIVRANEFPASVRPDAIGDTIHAAIDARVFALDRAA